jgi:hypothetical protein
MRLLGALFLFACPSSAHAYLPPAFFIYSKVVEPKAKALPITGIALTIARPQAGGTEEILGTYALTDWKNSSDGWPTLSLIFDSDQDALIKSVSSFGLPVLKEADLLRIEKEKVALMKDPPRSFYRTDPNMALKRTRQTYAWVHGNKESGKAVWVEKDSFLPLKVAGPCPPAATSLGWAKSGANQCEVEFRNLHALKRGNFSSARLTLWKDGVPLLFLNFEKVATGKMPVPKSDERLPPDVKEIAETILH